MRNYIVKGIYRIVDRINEAYNPQDDIICDGVTKYDVIDWLSEHPVAYDDICNYFEIPWGAEDLLYDMDKTAIMDWISEHEQLAQDLDSYFNCSMFEPEYYGESLNEQIWSSYPGDNYLNNKKNIIDSVNKFITKYNLNDVSIDNIVYRPDLDTALINIVFTPQIREYAPSIIDDFCKDIVKELRNKSKEKLLYRKYIHDSNTFLPAIELVRSFDESLKEDYNSDLQIEREIQKYLDDHDLWGEVSVQDGTVYVEINWGDWKHEHLRCRYLMNELGYQQDYVDVTEEDGSDCYSAIHTYIKKDMNESLSLKELKESFGDDPTDEGWLDVAKILYSNEAEHIMGSFPNREVVWEGPDRYFVCPECGEPLFARDFPTFDYFTTGSGNLTCPICDTQWLDAYDVDNIANDVLDESLTESLNGVDKVAQASQNIVQKNRNTWLPIYYDIKNKTVLTEDDYKKLKDKTHIFKVTELIKPNTAEEIERVVNKALSM